MVDPHQIKCCVSFLLVNSQNSWYVEWVIANGADFDFTVDVPRNKPEPEEILYHHHGLVHEIAKIMIGKDTTACQGGDTLSPPPPETQDRGAKSARLVRVEKALLIDLKIKALDNLAQTSEWAPKFIRIDVLNSNTKMCHWGLEDQSS